MTFVSPKDERGWQPAVRKLQEAGGWLLGGLGWFTIALGCSSAQTTLWPAVCGALTVLFSIRAFRATLVMEWFCLAWCLALLPPEFRDWAWLGAFSCILGRVMSQRWSQR